MGGDQPYPYPRHVWSPSGGPWANHPNWKQNRNIAFAALAVVGVGMYWFESKYALWTSDYKQMPYTSRMLREDRKRKEEQAMGITGASSKSSTSSQDEGVASKWIKVPGK